MKEEKRKPTDQAKWVGQAKWVWPLFAVFQNLMLRNTIKPALCPLIHHEINKHRPDPFCFPIDPKPSTEWGVGAMVLGGFSGAVSW